MSKVRSLATLALVPLGALTLVGCPPFDNPNATVSAPPLIAASTGPATACDLSNRSDISTVMGTTAAEAATTATATKCVWPAAGSGKGTASIELEAERPNAIQDAITGGVCTATTPTYGDRSCINAEGHMLFFAKKGKVYTLSCDTASAVTLGIWARQVSGAV